MENASSADAQQPSAREIHAREDARLVKAVEDAQEALDTKNGGQFDVGPAPQQRDRRAVKA